VCSNFRKHHIRGSGKKKKKEERSKKSFGDLVCFHKEQFHGLVDPLGQVGTSGTGTSSIVGIERVPGQGKVDKLGQVELGQAPS